MLCHSLRERLDKSEHRGGGGSQKLSNTASRRDCSRCFAEAHSRIVSGSMKGWAAAGEEGAPCSPVMVCARMLLEQLVPEGRGNAVSPHAARSGLAAVKISQRLAGRSSRACHADVRRLSLSYRCVACRLGRKARGSFVVAAALPHDNPLTKRRRCRDTRTKTDHYRDCSPTAIRFHCEVSEKDAKAGSTKERG